MVSEQNDTNIVVVPFTGLGSELVATRDMALPFIGFDINPDYVSLCKRRLADH
jgi:site-specific DNA-methyltransferase (adenine-specific)